MSPLSAASLAGQCPERQAEGPTNPEQRAPEDPQERGARTRPGTEGDILMGGERDQRHHVSRTRMLSGGESPFIGSSWAASDTAVSFQTRQGPGAEAHPEIP